MANPHGSPIWYELVARDAEAARLFYQAVIGWTIGERPADGMDYRMIAAVDGHVGGLAGLSPDMPGSAATPGWRFYIGVDDVDRAVARIEGAGGSVAIPAFDFPGVGRMALVRDPQGIAFFVMRGASDEDSTAFDPLGPGRCSWNELATPDQEAANAFYGAAFGWTFPERMAMPGMGDYVFIHDASGPIGATMTARADGAAPGWTFYFRVADIDTAAKAVLAHGGTVHMGPAEVPGGERIVVAGDPAGAVFGLVGPGAGA